MANPNVVTGGGYSSSLEEDDSAAVDFLTMGVSAAAVSAGLGIYNTGIALGQAFGVEGLEQKDVASTLENMGAHQTADFYRKHSTGLDVTGFIAGSFLPGGLAVKGLQGAQRGLSVSARLSSGFSRVLLPDNRLRVVREAIKREGMDATAIVKKEKLRTIAAGFHQQALEAAAFEGAVLLTMNQSPALDSEDLGYFDSVLGNLDTAAAGLVFGTALGGTFQAVSNWGVLKNEKSLYDLSTGNAQLKHATVEERLGVAEGHRSLVLANDYINTKTFRASEEYNKLSPGDKRNWETRAANVRLELEKSVLRASRGDVAIKDELMSILDTGKLPPDELFGGVSHFRPMHQRDILYDVPVTQVDFLEDVEAEEFLFQTYKRYAPDEDEVVLRAKAKDFVSGVYGAAYGNVNVNTNQLNQRGFVKLEQALADARQDPAYWNHMATLRHETGHTLLDESRQTLSSRSPLMRRLLDKAEEQSRLARPDDWMYADWITNRMDAQNYVPTERELKHIQYMNSPNELFADAYSRMTDPNIFANSAQMLKEQPELYRFMVNNKALAARYRMGKQVLDLKTGELLPSTVLPTAADMSPAGIRIVKDTVRWGKDEATSLKEAFDPYTVNPIKANALYAVARDRTDLLPTDVVDFTDIPRLTAWRAQGGKPAAIMKDGVNIRDMYPDMDSLIIHAKAELAQEMKRRSYHGVQRRNEASGVTPKGREVASAPDAQGIVNIHIEDFVGLEVEGARIMSAAEIARILDVHPEFVNKASAIVRTIDPAQGVKSLPEGMLVPERDMPFASLRDDYDPYKPEHVVVQADRKSVVDGSRIWGMAETQKIIRAQRAAIDTAVAGYAGKDFDSLPQSAVESGYNFGDNVSSVAATSGLVTSANQEPFSGGSVAQLIGVILDRFTKRKKTEVSQAFDASIVKLAANEGTVMEAAVLDSIIRQAPSGQEYEFVPGTLKDFIDWASRDGINPEALEAVVSSGLLKELVKPGEDVIWRGEVRDAIRKVVRNPDYTVEEAEEALSPVFEMLKDGVHTIKDKELGKFWRQMVKYNGEEIVQHKNSLAARIGGNAHLNPNALYAGPADTALYPFHALVVSKQKGVLGMQDTGMVVAKDANDLQRKIADLRAQYSEDELGIYTKREIEEYKKAQADYVGAKLFRESSVNSVLSRKGVMWDVLPQPNPQLFNQYKAMLERQHERLARGMIEAKYGEELASLRQFSQYQGQFVSTTGGTRKERNIYSDIEKLMLNKRPEDSDNLWHQLNTVSEKAISTAYYTLLNAGRGATKTGDWEKMNEVLENYGMRKVYDEATPLLLTNVDAPRPVLAPLISKMNFIVGTSMLRMDSAHAIVNAVSLPIMLQSEFSALKRFAAKDRWQVAMDGTSVQVPGRPEKLGASLMPLALQAIKDMFTKPELIAKYRARGLLNSTLEDIAAAEADFAKIAGQTDPAAIDGVLTKIINTISAPSDYSEQLTKFVAARTADLFTETLRIPESMRWATINTFTSRVVGNYQASQRPTLFQGWGGQAIGLFQTYQFNLLQSLFSNVSHGNKIGVASMLGLQAGIFGAQSVPGFQMVNQYVGERSQGNRDFYSTARSMMGNELGDWLMYGTASSATVPIVGVGIDLYARGDLTPRTPILLPTSISEVPAVAIPTKVVGSILGAIDKITDGAPAKQSWLEALAHSGFNRPIAGLTQLALGQRTSTQGQMVVDLPDVEFLDPDTWDVWNMATRALGTKPLDESIAVSAFYRTLGYRAARQDQINSLGESYKTALRSGTDTPEQYLSFAAEYAARGGNAENFQEWVRNNYQNATTGQIDRLRRTNSSPEGRYLQEIMGARGDSMVGDYGEDTSIPK